MRFLGWGDKGLVGREQGGCCSTRTSPTEAPAATWLWKKIQMDRLDSIKLEGKSINVRLLPAGKLSMRTVHTQKPAQQAPPAHPHAHAPIICTQSTYHGRRPGHQSRPRGEAHGPLHGAWGAALDAAAASRLWVWVWVWVGWPSIWSVFG